MSEPYDVIRFSGHNVNQQWLEQRKKGVGGSDVSAIMGLSRYKGPYALWAEKSGLVIPEDISDKPAVMVGNALEDPIRRWFRDRHPELVVTASNCILRSKRRPWAQASLDGVCHIRGSSRSDKSSYAVLEIKTVGERSIKDWYDDSGKLTLPIYYLCQVTHYLSVTGWSKAYVAALFGNRELVELEIMRDEDDIRAVESAVDEFWQRVQTGDEPPVDGSPGEAEALFKRHQTSDGEVWDCGDMPREVADYIYYKETADAAKERLEKAGNALKRLIGDRKGIKCPDYIVTWPRGTRKTFDKKRFMADHPDLYEQYVTACPSNSGIRIKERKK